MDPTLSQIHPDNIKRHFFKIYLYIILPSLPRYLKFSSLWISIRATFPAHFVVLNLITLTIYGKEHIMQIIQFFSASCYLL